MLLLMLGTLKPEVVTIVDLHDKSLQGCFTPRTPSWHEDTKVEETN
jgi:hypothetical protein